MAGATGCRTGSPSSRSPARNVLRQTQSARAGQVVELRRVRPAHDHDADGRGHGPQPADEGEPARRSRAIAGRRRRLGRGRLDDLEREAGLAGAAHDLDAVADLEQPRQALADAIVGIDHHEAKRWRRAGRAGIGVHRRHRAAARRDAAEPAFAESRHRPNDEPAYVICRGWTPPRRRPAGHRAAAIAASGTTTSMVVPSPGTLRHEKRGADLVGPGAHPGQPQVAVRDARRDRSPCRRR